MHVWLAGALLVALSQQAKDNRPKLPDPVQERVTVTRVVIAGRVIDSFARSIPGLTRGNFRLRVDGQDAPIESVSWTAEPSFVGQEAGVPQSAQPAAPALARQAALAPSRAPTGNTPRTIVMLFQWEIAGQKDEGVVRMMRQAERMIETAQPGDTFAVLRFGASLRLLQDLTTDREALRDSIESIQSWHFRGAPPSDNARSLGDSIENCRPKSSIRKAIICIGKSLRDLPGPKEPGPLRLVRGKTETRFLVC